MTASGNPECLLALNAGSSGTLNGQKVEFAVEDGRLKVNSSTISTVDIECGNGIIHVIDTVMLPMVPAS